MKRQHLYLRGFCFCVALLLGMQFAKGQGSYDPKAADSVKMVREIIGLDTTYRAALPTITVTHVWVPRYAPLTIEEKEQHWRRIRDVKKVYPLAEVICDMIVETYEYMETLPNERARRKHLKRFEEETFAEYKPIMKKLTLSQGRLLIKLIDRETSMSSYEIIKAFYGGWRATWYDIFADFYGGDLRSEYDPRYNADDALTERIIYLYERNLI